MFKYHQKFGESDFTALLIDDRENLAHWWTIPWTLDMLGPSWTMQIISRQVNRNFFKFIIDEYELENSVRLDTFEDLYGYDGWMGETWVHSVQFLLSRQFWEAIHGEHILTIQDHGVPIQRWDTRYARNTLRKVFEYGYAGAPWTLEETESVSKLFRKASYLHSLHPSERWRESPGGNGGFSYRRRSLCLKHGIDLDVPVHLSMSKAGYKRFNELGVEHEDWVWGQILSSKEKKGVAPVDLENRFAAESLLGKDPLGVHNFAGLHSPTETLNMVQRAASRFFRVSNDVFTVVNNEDGCKSTRHHFEHESWQPILSRFPRASLPVECSLCRSING